MDRAVEERVEEEESMNENDVSINAKIEELEVRLNQALETVKEQRDRIKYLEGMRDAMKFAIRCNGVSGGEVM